MLAAAPLPKPASGHTILNFDASFAVAVLAALVAGLVRGFSGFGGALIFMPVVGALYSPRIAAPTFLILDFILTLPMSLRAIPACRWPIVLPTAIAAMVTAPVGAYLLAAGDPVTLRWAICGVVVLLLALLASGWRYHGEPKTGASLGVGGVAGLLGGIGQISGPPVIAFWVSGRHPAHMIRANMFVFFMVISLSSAAAYLWNGLFTPEIAWLIVVLIPTYALALYAGSHVFGRYAGRGYRSLAYAIIALAAITSVPALDGILR